MVDYGEVNVIEAPWEDFYVDRFGFIGNNYGNWSFEASDLIGNAGMSGSAVSGVWPALRGSMDLDVTPTTEKALKVTGTLKLEGGGFEDAGSLRLGLFYSTNAGNLTKDVTPENGDSTRWSGAATNNYGYLLLPNSGSNALTTWNGTGACAGAVVNGEWFGTNDAGSYGMSTLLQQPSGAVAGAGTYSFAISVMKKAAGNEIRYTIDKDGYHFGGIMLDNHSSLAASKFNSFNIGISNSTTTKLSIEDLYVSMGDPVDSALAVSVEKMDKGIPTVYELSQNYPNPFNPSTTIEFALPKNGDVKLVVYDVVGKEVATLFRGELNAGYHKVNFDASSLSTGIYFYSIKAGDFTNVKKLVLLK